MLTFIRDYGCLLVLLAYSIQLCVGEREREVVVTPSGAGGAVAAEAAAGAQVRWQKFESSCHQARYLNTN